MSEAYTIAIAGFTNYVPVDEKSEASFASLGVADPMTEWLNVPILGLQPEYSNITGYKETTSGIAVHRQTQKLSFSILVDDMKFPDDMAKLSQIAAVLRNKYIFLYKGDYPSSGDWSLHEDSMALGVAMNIETEHSFENGTKSLTLSGRTIKPVRWL